MMKHLRTSLQPQAVIHDYDDPGQVENTDYYGSVDERCCKLHTAAEKARRCYELLKFLMFFFNGLFWGLGVLALGIGLALRLDGGFRSAASDQVPGAGIGGSLLTVAGAIAVVTGFLGCCGAVKESRCLLAAFFLTLSAVFLLLIGSGIWAAASKERLSHRLEAELHRRVAAYEADAQSREAMDNVQRLFDCCGVSDGASDYKRYNIQPPESCGHHLHAGRSSGGCYQNIVNLLTANLEVIAGAGIGIAIVMVLGMILSMMLCRKLGSADSNSAVYVVTRASR